MRRRARAGGCLSTNDVAMPLPGGGPEEALRVDLEDIHNRVRSYFAEAVRCLPRNARASMEPRA